MKVMRLLLVPSLFALAAAYSIAPNYFFSSGDPDIGYLVNSLRLTEGMFAWHVDHPGSILQMFGAFVIEAIKLLRRDSDGLRVLIENLPVIYYGTWMLSLASLLAAQFFLGWVLLRRGYGFLIATTAQLVPALFATMPLSLVRVNSEATLAAAGLLVAAAFAPFAEAAPTITRRQMIFLGCAIGVAMTTKANIWPVALLCFAPLFLARRNGKAVFLILASMLTTFVLLTFPAWPRYGYQFPWLADLFLHNGRYGGGTGFITSPQELKRGMETYMSSLQRQQLVAVAASIFLIAIALRQRLATYLPVSAAFLAIGFLLLKHPAMRYALALVPLVVISILVLPRLNQPVKTAVTAVLLVLAIDGLWERSIGTRAWHAQLSRLHRELAGELNGPSSDCAVVMLHLAVPLPEAGLMKGHDEWSANTPWEGRMNSLFPRYFSLLNTGASRFGRAMPLASWTAEVNHFPCQVFVASKLANEADPLDPPKEFAGEFRDITSAGEQNKIRLFRHDGALKLLAVKN